jgi:hypothetical protein
MEHAIRVDLDWYDARQQRPDRVAAHICRTPDWIAVVDAGAAGGVPTGSLELSDQRLDGSAVQRYGVGATPRSCGTYSYSVIFCSTAIAGPGYWVTEAKPTHRKMSLPVLEQLLPLRGRPKT